MALPPLDAEGVKLTVARCQPAVAFTPVGAPGAVFVAKLAVTVQAPVICPVV
jgi:hypothetical protein